MKAGEAPTHVMKFCVQDWLSSPLRGQLALERDHLARMVYLELLFKLHENGGSIARADVAGAIMVSEEEAGQALDRLITSGRLSERDGVISNPRVLSDLAREQQFRAEQAERGRLGGTARAKRPLDGRQADAKRSVSPPAPAPAPAPVRQYARPPESDVEQAIWQARQRKEVQLLRLVGRLRDAGYLANSEPVASGREDIAEAIMRHVTAYEQNGLVVKGRTKPEHLSLERLERSIEDAEAILDGLESGRADA